MLRRLARGLERIGSNTRAFLGDGDFEGVIDLEAGY